MEIFTHVMNKYVSFNLHSWCNLVRYYYKCQIWKLQGLCLAEEYKNLCAKSNSEQMDAQKSFNNLQR